MAKTKKSQDPAAIAERIEQRKAFVAAHPNLDPAEARKRFFVQTRAAELQAQGQFVDKAALRQKFTSGGVAREGFYTAADKKRYQQQSNRATGTGGGSGNVAEPAPESNLPGKSPVLNRPPTGRGSGYFVPPPTPSPTPIADRASTTTTTVPGSTTTTSTTVPKSTTTTTPKTTTTRDPRSGGVRVVSPGIRTAVRGGRSGEHGVPYSHTKIPKVADNEVPEWMHAAATVGGAVTSVFTGAAGAAAGAGFASIPLGIAGAAAGQAGGYTGSMYLLGALTGEPISDINAAIKGDVVNQAAYGAFGQGVGVGLGGLGKVSGKVLGGAGNLALKGATKFVPKVITSKPAQAFVRGGPKIEQFNTAVSQVVGKVSGANLGARLGAGARTAMGTKISGLRGRGSQPLAPKVAPVDTPVVDTPAPVVETPATAEVKGKWDDLTDEDLPSFLRFEHEEAPAPDFWTRYADDIDKGVISQDDAVATLTQPDIEERVAGEIAKGKSYGEIVTSLKTPAVVETPAVETPAVETPAVETPVPTAPVKETPAQTVGTQASTPKGGGGGGTKTPIVNNTESATVGTPTAVPESAPSSAPRGLTPDEIAEVKFSYEGLTPDEIIEERLYASGRTWEDEFPLEKSGPPQEPWMKKGESFDDYLHSARFKQYSKDLDAWNAAQKAASQQLDTVSTSEPTVGTPTQTVTPENQNPVSQPVAKGKKPKSGDTWPDEAGAATKSSGDTPKGKGSNAGKGKKKK